MQSTQRVEDIVHFRYMLGWLYLVFRHWKSIMSVIRPGNLTNQLYQIRDRPDSSCSHLLVSDV